jgi:hypothetical protein
MKRPRIPPLTLLLPLALSGLSGCMDRELPTAVLRAPPDAAALLSVQTSTTGSLVAWGWDGYDQVSGTPSGTVFAAVDAGSAHSVALRVDGSLVSWGDDRYGQVRNTPSGTGFVAVAAGQNHSVAIRADGSLVSWGEDSYSQVRNTPSGTGFVAVAAGGYHSVAIRADGSLVSWGTDVDGSVTYTPSGTDFVAVAAGMGHNVARRADGSLVSWGGNRSNQVSDTPSGTGFVAVAAGGYHSVAIRADGSLVSWGDDSVGQVSQSPSGTGYLAVAGGVEHGVAIRTDGSLVSWGSDHQGAVSNTPSGSFVAVAAGQNHSVALRGVTAKVTLQIPVPGTYDGTPRVVTAVTDPAGPSVVITYDGSATPPANAGTYAVMGTVTSPGYLGSASGTLTILQVAQTISFTSTPPDPGLVGGSYPVSATGGASGNQVVFSSLTPEVCSVTGSTVSLDATGTCTVAADQAGSTNFDAAPQVTQAFTVEAAAQLDIQRPGIDIEQVEITGASNARGTVEGSFSIRNASSGEDTRVTLGAVTVFFRSTGRGTRTEHTATCSVAPVATGYVLQPWEAREFTYACTDLLPSVPASARELTAVVTVEEISNQLGGTREGPRPTSSNPFRF